MLIVNGYAKEEYVMQYKIVVEKPKRKFGIYAWINVFDKMVYVGESSDLNRRLCEHLRSMYDLEESSNFNLVCASKVKGKQFAGVVLFDDVVYNKNSAYSSNEYLIDETIFMYAFVQKGYQLYNGKEVIKYNEGKIDSYPKRLTDNENGMRNFLRNNMDVMYEKLLDYCKYKGVLEKEKIDKKIECANKNIANAINRINEIDVTDKVSITSNRAKKIEIDNKEYYIVSYGDKEKEINKVCDAISKVFLQTEDLEELGLVRKSKTDFIRIVENGDLDRIAICGFGDYLDQSAITILRTKQYDISHNTLIVNEESIEISERKDKDKGICFWAYGRAETELYRNYLSKNNQLPKYLIMPYVLNDKYAKSNSGKENHKRNQEIFNLKEGESIEAFYEDMRKSFENNRINSFALGYALNKKDVDNKRGRKYKYPERMFPSIINKDRKSVAFLISEIGYIDEPIKIQDLYPYFTSNTNNPLNKTLNGQNNVACAELSDKEGLIDRIKNNCYEDNGIMFLLAKIEYPYIVALLNNQLPEGNCICNS